ncbi:MAG: aminotransferase class I/II-fold pyridoxal phosphate-dependent enzyme [Clostridium sp.]|nr:aminotransferase class I/II-fold pyridoxal phosphate-dependent enzyme [Clostridium sp.]
MSLTRKIKDYYKKGGNLLFTTPSHAQGEYIPDEAKMLLGKKFFKCDFSEIEDFDNLRHPEGILLELQDKISYIYQSKKSFMLTNGSSSGICALMLAILKPDDKVLVARNCHISVCNGLTLTGANPVWFLPEYDKEWGIFKGISPSQIENILKKEKDIKAVILTSPTYEGIFSDIGEISKITKKYNTKLIIDEAHGALVNFGEFKTKPAILCGADACVQSLHKTAGAPNPCALLHIAQNSSINSDSIQNALNLINTTSPSYPLLAAIEATVDFLASIKGKTQISKLLSDIKDLKNGCSENIIFYEGFNDPTKILIKIKGMNALKAAEILNKKYKIEEEFSTESYMLFITGIGTTYKKLKRLFEVLSMTDFSQKPNALKENEYYYVLPEKAMTPRQAYFANSKFIEKSNAYGKICAEAIISYPPGIPLIVPGEIITSEYITDDLENIKTID